MNKRQIKKRNKLTIDKTEFFDKHAIIVDIYGTNINNVKKIIRDECTNKHYKNIKRLKKKYKSYPDTKLYFMETNAWKSLTHAFKKD